jgi:hypothetical protein
LNLLLKRYKTQYESVEIGTLLNKSIQEPSSDVEFIDVSSKPLYQHNDKVLIRLDCAVHALRFNEEQSTAITTMMKMFTRIP